MNAITSCHDPAVVRRLYEDLSAEDVNVRLAAVEQLVALGDTSAQFLCLLRHRAFDPNLLVMDACLRAFRVLFPSDLTDVLLSLWRSGPPEHRDAVARLLARDGGEVGRDALAEKLNFLEFDLNPAAFPALAQHHGEFLLQYCETWCRHGSWQERAVAVRAVGRLPQEGWTDAGSEERAIVQHTCASLAQELCNDPDEQVRIAALRELYGLDQAMAQVQARNLLNDDLSEVCVAAIGILDTLEDVEILPRIQSLLSDGAGDVRAEALYFVSRWASVSEKRLAARRLIHDGYEDVVQIAVEVLGEVGEPQDLPELRAKIAWYHEGVARASLEAAASLCKDCQDEETQRGVLVDGLGHPVEDVFDLAYDTLLEVSAPELAVPCLMQALPGARQLAGRWILEKIQTLQPQRLLEAIQPEHLQQFPWPVDVSARQNVLHFFQQMGGEAVKSVLQQRLEDTESVIRACALRYLNQLDPERCQELAIQHLRDACPILRLVAVEVLADVAEPWLVDDLLPCARDADASVRREAIKALAKFDDPRILSELVSSLNDVDQGVKQAASAILHEQSEQPVPLLRTFGRRAGRRARWQELHEKAKQINRWASEIGQQLLGRPVRVFQHRQGLGYTIPANKTEAIEIYVSDSPVTSGHPYGEQIMKGLALHELGHHLYDIGVRGHSTMRGIARSEGIKDLYDILIDERLERGLRSRRPEWGVYFDRLASFAFAQNAHIIPVHEYARLLESTVEATIAGLQCRELPGRLLPLQRTRGVPKVVLRDRDLLTLPDAIPPMYAFLWCLRCGFDPQLYANQNVAAAIRLIPASLKEMRHAELLQLAREIAALVGDDAGNREQMQRTMSLLHTSPHLRGMLGRMLRGLGETQQLPDWLDQLPAGIRNNPIDVIHERPPKANRTKRGGRVLNLGEELEFPALEQTVRLEPDPAVYRRLVGPIRKHIRQMRMFFEKLGRRTIEHYASQRGRRLDIARVRDLALLNRPNALVHSYDEIAPDLYLGLLIDRSGSMSEGRMERAQSFAALLAESARGLRGIAGDIHAFDDVTLFQLGSFQRNAIEQLDAYGGNNDAGALQRAAELALRSGKRNRLLIMISDGMPAECTVASLRALVKRLTEEYQIVCAQVAVAPLPEICFPNYLDVSQYSLDEAVIRFGKMIMRLTKAWR